MIRLGCCGFPAAWEKYFRAFRLVEVQQTFYQPPRPATAERWRRGARELKTPLKTILFLMLVPGTMMGALPIWLIGTDRALFSFGVLRWLAIPLWAAGILGLLWCAWAFTVRGHGTPSPTDPPKELVVSGLYRYVRNPIYLAVIAVFLGYALWHASRALLACPVIVAISSHLFVVLYEEPTLRRVFGASYARYCQDVPRWIPRFKRLRLRVR